MTLISFSYLTSSPIKFNTSEFHSIMNDHSSTTINGGTPSSGPEALKVVIVGAGIGGLFAAIALRAAGHHVSIYESSRFALETGAAVHLQPNVVGLLYKYGIRPEDFGAVTCESITERLPSGGVKFSADVKGVGKAYPYPWQLVHRIDLHNALKNKATDERGEGKPVEIHLKSRVASVDVEESTIVLHDGRRIKGDLVLGADGVHVSRYHKSSKSLLTFAVYCSYGCPW